MRRGIRLHWALAEACSGSSTQPGGKIEACEPTTAGLRVSGCPRAWSVSRCSPQPESMHSDACPSVATAHDTACQAAIAVVLHLFASAAHQSHTPSDKPPRHITATHATISVTVIVSAAQAAPAPRCLQEPINITLAKRRWCDVALLRHKLRSSLATGSRCACQLRCLKVTNQVSQPFNEQGMAVALAPLWKERSPPYAVYVPDGAANPT